MSPDPNALPWSMTLTNNVALSGPHRILMH